MKKDKNKNREKGYTLIEVLMVVLIIAILVAIALPSYQRSVERSRAANPIANLGSIAKAQNLQKMATMHYTNKMSNLDIALKDEESGEMATNSTFESEYFTYRIYGDDRAVALATRKNVSEDKQYELSVDYNTNQIYCRPMENKTCIDLGLEEGQDYGSNSGGTPCNGEMNAFTRDGVEEEISSYGGTCTVDNGVVNYSYCDGIWCYDGTVEENSSIECADQMGNIECTYVNTNDGIEETGTCSGANVSNTSCVTFDNIVQIDNNDTIPIIRECLEINALECNNWSAWTPIK